jgi:hypothetical protein
MQFHNGRKSVHDPAQLLYRNGTAQEDAASDSFTVYLNFVPIQGSGQLPANFNPAEPLTAD